MGAVSAQTRSVRLPWGRPLTVADLEAMPDDGHRYELIDGVLIVTPAPGTAHQRAVVALLRSLADACPSGAGLEVLVAPYEVVLADDTSVQPDLLVARRDQLTDRCLPAAPVLAVEILSPNNPKYDLDVKRDRYQRAGVPSYWVVDPQVPRLRVWELRKGGYQQIADIAGDQTWTASKPYEITIVPARLRG